MSEQLVIWTALPVEVRSALVVGDEAPSYLLELSVHVSPRLRTGGPDSTLASFPDFVDWPSTLAGTTFEVRVGAAELPATVTSSPSSAAWKALFASSSLVRSHVYDDATNNAVSSYPAASIATWIKGVYSEVALASPTDFPNAGVLVLDGALSSVPIGHDRKTSLLAALDAARTAPRGWVAGSGAVPPISAADPEKTSKELVQFEQFHQVLVSGQGELATSPAPPVNEALDFHQVVSAAGQYPGLMRHLGLVVDLQVEIAAAAMPVAATTTLSVVPTWTPKLVGPTRDVAARTTCELSSTAFRAVPYDPTEVVGGYLPMEDATRFEPVVVDVDGAALKATTFAETMNQALGKSGAGSPDTAALPALRSGGLAVARAGKAVLFVNGVDFAKQLDTMMEAGGVPTLFAEHLLRGWRIDVWDSASGSWSSLMRRTGSYKLGTNPASPVLTLPDTGEGYVSTTATTDFFGTPGGLFVPEWLFAWEGWSLVAPRPGKTIGVAAPVEDPDNAPGPDFPILADFAAANGSLPVLRYGRRYRVRARAADLAGNGPSLAAAGTDATHATAEVVYARFEPVPTPTVLLRQPRTEGESVERLVIRSDVGTSPASPAERHVAPPKTAQIVAEQHGMLDRVVAGRVGPDPARYALLKDRDTGGFHSGHPDVAHDPREHADVFYFPLAGKTGANAQVAIDYLPDPMSAGATLHVLPGPGGTPDQFHGAPFAPADGDSWPAQRPFRLVVDGGTPFAVAWEDASRELRVSLPQAEVVTARLSSNVDRSKLDQLGLWQWIKDQPGADAATVAEGRHWMFTPYRELTLVHAVRRPLATPELVDPSATRHKGQTFALVNDNLAFHRRSTGRVDVHASWTEPVDFEPPGPGEPDPPDPTTRQGGGLAFSVDGDRTFGFTAPDPFVLELADRHEFGDTKHRMVEYRAVATSRFTGYFVEHHLYDTATATSLVVQLAPGPLVDGSVTVKTPDGSKTLAEGTHYTVDAAAGTLTFTSAPSAGTYDIAFLAAPVHQESLRAKSVDVRSSARPPAPDVQYVLPAFEWNELPHPASQVISSTRQGGWLRVYLERPWYASGENEKLGVVLWSSPPSTGAFEVPGHVRPWVSTWGIDPVYSGHQLPTRFPTLAAFPATATPGTGLVLPETSVLVDVAGHDVAWAADRKLWYADVKIDAGTAYQPFVRLALARFQPSSLSGCHLSPVVLADYMQLAPGRTLTITPGSKPTTRTVTLAGFSYDRTAIGANVGEAYVTVETKDPAVPGDELGWSSKAGPTALQPSALFGYATWKGEVTVPTSGVRIRLVIEQYELLPLQPRKTTLIEIPGRRLVHADVVEIYTGPVDI